MGITEANTHSPAALAACGVIPAETPTRLATAAAMAAPAAEPVRRMVVMAAAPAPRSAPLRVARIRWLMKL